MANEQMAAPRMLWEMENWEPDGAGGVRKVWRQAGGENVVCQQGMAYLLNRCFGGTTSHAQAHGPYLMLHSGGTNSTHVWSQVSQSALGSFGTAVPNITFGTDNTAQSATGYTSFQFTASTQTISGACLLWFSTNTLATSNLSSTAAIRLYNNGSIAAQQVQANNTVSVSVTLAFSTTN